MALEYAERNWIGMKRILNRPYRIHEFCICVSVAITLFDAPLHVAWAQQQGQASQFSSAGGAAGVITWQADKTKSDYKRQPEFR